MCRFCGAVLTDRSLPAFVPLRQAPDVEKRLREKPAHGHSKHAMEDVFSAEASSLRGEFTRRHRQRLVEFVQEGKEEYRNAAILFVDVSGYTALSESMRTEYVKDTLDAFYEVCSQTITAHNGFIVKFEGDACLAVFGAPVAYDRDVEGCVRAALEIRDAVDAFPPVGECRLQVSAGIDTGEVLISFTERHGARDFDVFGPTVNLAARIESAAEVGTVRVSPRTRELVAGVFTFQEHAPLRFKNVDQPVVTYTVTGEREGGPARRDFTTPFIGREKETAAIQSNWSAFLAGKTSGWSGLRVAGVPGIGKSRLLRHFFEEQRGALEKGIEAPSFELCIAESSPQGVHQAYGLWREILRPWYERQPPGGAGLGLRSLFGEEDALGQARALGPSVMQRHILSDIRGALEAMAQEQPLVLLFDDMQWADASSLAMLENLLDSAAIVDVFLLFSYRVEWPWPFERNRFPFVKLAALKRADRMALADRLFPVEMLSEGVLESLTQQSGGNPLFLIEIVRTVMEQLATLNEEERKDLPRKVREWVPRSLHGLMLSRIDLLEKKRRQVLQCGSVLGQRFAFRILEFFRAIRDGLIARLYALKGLEFLDDIQDARELEFIFRHHLMRETAYQSLLERQRRELHLTVAEELEERFEEKLDAYYSTLGFHYEQAEIPDQAARYWRLAGERALLQGALPDALQCFEHTLRLWSLRRLTETRRGMWYAVLRQKGRTLRLLGRMEEALKVFEEGMSAKTDLAQAEFLTEKAVTLSQTGDFAGARKYLTRARRRLDLQKADPMLWAMVETTWGTCALGQGKWNQARKSYDTVLKKRFPGGQIDIQSDARNNLALLDWRLGRLDDALAGFRKALRYWKKIQNPFGMGAVRMNMGIIEETRGRFRQARRAYEEALEISQRVYFPQLETAVAANLGNLLHGMGRYAEALEHNGRSLEIARSIRDERSEAIALENLALGHIALGQWKQAEGYRKRAVSVARRMGDRDRLVSLDLVEAEGRLARLPEFRGAVQAKNMQKTNEILSQIEDNVKKGRHYGESARLARLQYHCALEAQDPEEARKAYRHARRIAEKTEQFVEGTRIEKLKEQY